MKNLLFSLLTLSFLLFFGVASGDKVNDSNPGEQQSSVNGQNLQVVCSSELTAVISKWANDFGSDNPEVEISVDEYSGEKEFQTGKLYLLSSNHKELIQNKSLWEITVAHDVIVPIINSNNPVKDKILEKGITPGCFSNFVSENGNWSEIIDDAQSSLQCFILDHPQVLSKVAGCANVSQSEMKASKIATVESLLSEIRQNESAVGFCRLTDIMNAGENAFAEQISILPFDKNQNGRIDGFEKIYSNPAELSRGVWIGKYPRELSGKVYAAAAVKPTDGAAHNFLEYAITSGQETLSESGFSHLSSVEKSAGMRALGSTAAQSGGVTGASGLPSAWKFVFGILATVLIIASLVRSGRKAKKEIIQTQPSAPSPLKENSILAPGGLFYDKTHTWAFMEKNGQVKIGINDFLQHVTGDVTEIKMKAPGEKIRKGEKILTLMHKGKQLSIYSPVSGLIKEQNEQLQSQPSQINASPYSNGWVYQIEPSNWAREISFMFMADNFRTWLNDEFTRLKDFLAIVANASQIRLNQPVLQDGGEVTDNVLAGLAPEIWEEFQYRFIDPSK